MKNMCDSCPNRAMANLNRALGNEDEAKRIESLGCQWWWGINYTNQETKVTKLVYDCGVPHIAKIIMDQGALIEEASQSIQSNRNEIAKIGQQVSDRLLILDGLKLIMEEERILDLGQVDLAQAQLPALGAPQDELG